MFRHSPAHAKRHDALLFWWAVWSCLGMVAVCTLFGLGVFAEWTEGLGCLFTGNPFYLEPSAMNAPVMSPGVAFTVALLLVFYTVVVMLREPSRLRRLCVWAGMLGVLALTCMVGVLWDVYFNVLSSVTAVAVGGLGALFSPGIHASAHAADALAEEGKKEDEGS
ncbi:hypothetical protein ICN84_11530 [Akkermansia glycaniphila]|uniref:hypothetical protein n=1 Tax=Akkermansia glycaniphila TaxID=1679444 RepID=UPI001C025F43|nr:hypothetical protein [Akkermansia glycaniphila]MBT9450697.1 hypothetical protein [Akkermansia glycaniphila]